VCLGAYEDHLRVSILTSISLIALKSRDISLFFSHPFHKVRDS
jgi:hypothetical protein